MMQKISDEQIELLVKALRETEAARATDLSHLIGGGESLDFYRGMIGGLLVSHQLLKACRIEDKSLAELISLAAARASEQYLNLKNSEEFFFPDVIESE